MACSIDYDKKNWNGYNLAPISTSTVSDSLQTTTQFPEKTKMQLQYNLPLQQKACQLHLPLLLVFLNKANARESNK